MENNPFDETSEEFNPGKKALDKLSEGSEETPEKWIEKLNTEGAMNEKDSSSRDKKPDSISLYFQAINPLGLKIAELKDNLLEHIAHLKESIHDVAIDESLSLKKRGELMKDLERRILEKEKWVSRIDYFFANDELEPFDESPLPEHRIGRIIDQQKHPDQN